MPASSSTHLPFPLELPVPFPSTRHPLFVLGRAFGPPLSILALLTANDPARFNKGTLESTGTELQLFL